MSRPFFARNKLMSGGVFWVSFWGGNSAPRTADFGPLLPLRFTSGAGSVPTESSSGEGVACESGGWIDEKTDKIRDIERFNRELEDQISEIDGKLRG